MAKRVYARIPDEMATKIEVWAEKLGLSQAQLMGMSIQAGLDSIIRAVSPAESFTPGQWALIVKAMNDQGLSFDGTKIGSEEVPGDKPAS